MKAEIKKTELAIANSRQELQELKHSDSFLALSNRKEIKAAEEQLQKLELNLIDLQAMTAEEFYIKAKFQEKKDYIKKVSGNIFFTVGDVVESVGKVIPVIGGVTGKLIGKGLKTISKKIND